MQLLKKWFLIVFIFNAKTSFAADITLSFVGDCALVDLSDTKRSDSLSSYYKKYGKGYFTENVKDIFDSSNLTIANCEGVFCNLPATPKYRTPKKGRAFWLKGAPELAEIFKEGGINLVNIANNHTLDYKTRGFNDTLQALTNVEVDYFGKEDSFITEIDFTRIGFFGLSLMQASESQIRYNIESLKNEGCDIVIANFHGGEEYAPNPNDQQINVAKLAIDLGADAVIGHHPHILQRISYYKDRPIAYSLGNFIFGANRNPKDKRSMIFRLHIVRDYYTGEYSFTHSVIPVQISGESSYNDYRPIILTGTPEGDAIINLVTDESSAAFLQNMIF